MPGLVRGPVGAERHEHVADQRPPASERHREQHEQTAARATTSRRRPGHGRRTSAGQRAAAASAPPTTADHAEVMPGAVACGARRARPVQAHEQDQERQRVHARPPAERPAAASCAAGAGCGRRRARWRAGGRVARPQLGDQPLVRIAQRGDRGAHGLGGARARAERRRVGPRVSAKPSSSIPSSFCASRSISMRLASADHAEHEERVVLELVTLGIAVTGPPSRSRACAPRCPRAAAATAP